MKELEAVKAKNTLLALLLTLGSQALFGGALGIAAKADEDDPKPPKTCTFVGSKSGEKSKAKKEEWEKERQYFLRFLDEAAAVYLEDAKSNPKNVERNWWEQQRGLEEEVKSRMRIASYGPISIKDDYRAELGKEENEGTYWTFLISLGTAKGYVTGWLSDFPNSIDKQIALTKGWENGGSSRAVSLKLETLEKLGAAKARLNALNKLISTYACPSAKKINTTGWSDDIADKAFKIWNAADDMQTANFNKVDNLASPPSPAYLRQRLTRSPEKIAWDECMNETRRAAFPGQVDPLLQRSACGAPPTRVYVPE